MLYFFIKVLIALVRKDESVFSDPTYNVSVLFGKRDEVSSLNHLASNYDMTMHRLLTVPNFVTAATPTSLRTSTY